MVQLKNHRLGGECPGQAASIAQAHAEQADDRVCQVRGRERERRKKRRRDAYGEKEDCSRETLSIISKRTVRSHNTAQKRETKKESVTTTQHLMIDFKLLFATFLILSASFLV
jgi:hypothetical protein